jgi:hypothetical protein
MFFRAKKWLWTKFTERKGPDSAYAKYLENFNRVQANADSALQKELNVKAMSKEEFISVWNSGNKKSKPGCCS